MVVCTEEETNYGPRFFAKVVAICANQGSS